MIKGVNKCVVEVNNTENDYFERAILFVRPEKQNADRSLIAYQADTYLKTLKKRGGATRHRRALLSTVAKFTCAAGAGAALTGILLRL